MKTVYYSITYSDGIKQFLSKQISENSNEDAITDALFESEGIKNVKTFHNKEEWELAKKSN